ncbi:AraC family transcriptional regulator [Sphingomonas sp. BT-65]|uniref:AraC family transcriptional regulator n=1 Tax=Sphingomonas sp. BT-65 TaxID=2989821 RepID=UPI002236BF0E|nr:AraC family transcriptional regulator [Sphingomonas sp. BT-65]MCW4460728.1 AraC family transcriptional regulator [Sphingomonas sp. BT-65]
MDALSGDYRRVEPLADGHRWFGFRHGRFDTGHRTGAPLVEGVIRSSHHIVMVTLTGSARQLEVHSDCGHRFAGRERAGAVSFVPAGCERRLVLRDVSSQWGSIEIAPGLAAEIWPEETRKVPNFAFTNAHHPLIASIVGGFDQFHRSFGTIDAAYCESMILALTHYLAWQSTGGMPERRTPHRLSPSQLRRVRDLVEAKLDQSLSVSDLAGAAGVSTGHFHRAFRATTGITPLQYLQEVRVDRAARLIVAGAGDITQIAFQVGFGSSGHFAQLFARKMGLSPSTYRRLHLQ